MPYKKSYKTNRKNKPKRQFRKRNYKKNNQMVKFNSNWQVTQPQMLIADRQFVTLRYQETSLQRTSLTIPFNDNKVIATYRANDLDQHNSTGAPVIIPGLAEWSNFYARYKVHAVKVKVSMCSNDSLTIGEKNVPLIGFLHLQSDSSPGTFTTWGNLRQLEGNRYSVFKPLAITQAGAQTQPTIMKKYYKLKYASGNPKAYLADNTYEGITNPVGPPPRLFNYYVGALTMTGSNTDPAGAGQSVSVMLSTKLYVEFKDRIDLVN